MQLILDADNIDIKGNMSTIEQESLNEKFLANKIIDHLADDITSGNKENIQKQDNIIPDSSENDITDSDKEIAADVTLTNSLNEESLNEEIADTENVENLEEVVSQIDSSNTNPETVSEDPIVESENTKEESQVVDNVISGEEQSVDDFYQELEKENASNILSQDNNGTVDECSTQKENDDVELIIKGHGENKVDIEEVTTVKLTTGEKEEKEGDLGEGDSVKVTTDENEEKEEDLNKSHAKENITVKNEENQADVDKESVIKVITEEIKENIVERIDVDDAVEVTTEENKDNHVNEVVAVAVTPEDNKEKQVDVTENDAVEVTAEKRDKHVDVDDVGTVTEDLVKATDDIEIHNTEIDDTVTEDLVKITDETDIPNTEIDNTVTEDLIKITNQTDIPNTAIDDKSEEMECSVMEPTEANSLNENNIPIEIDDEDETSIEKNSSPTTEVLALDENMEVEESEGTLHVQELDDNMEVQELDDNMESQELDENTQDKVISIEEPKLPQKDAAVVKTVEEEPKRICKLSNNLDIFSDEEEDSVAEPPKNDTPPTTEKCINIDDDDDIVLIDEASNEKDKEDNATVENDTKITSDNIEPVLENAINENVCTETVQVEDNIPKVSLEPNETDASKITEPEQIVTKDVPSNETSEEPQVKVQDEKEVKKPLLPKHFIKTCKKNLADMTRDDLEDFCVLKIVESIVDRSNLGEIKSQLKNLTQTMDECKKKCLLLSKQNKDLQVVLKSVQEEQKITPDVHVTPLKITRSVGMQVVMVVDKNNIRKKSVNGVGTPATISGNNTNIKQTKSLPPPNTRSNKEKNTNNQPIPVPRLVPAVTTAKTNQTVTNNVVPKHNNVVTNPCIPNGVRNSPPVQKAPEKRSRSQAVTVDLTDDEPPAKLPAMQRGGVNQAMRVSGTPPNVMQPQRFTATNMNSPRKVYIPISGTQAQNVRAGQTIMLKTVPAMGPRQRCPTPQVAKVPQNPSQVRITRLQPNRHPAPLPDAMKQYQPPNWKALPPAPDLKLSKVENGIVISWRIDSYQEENHEEIASYQLYAYQETTAPPSTALWKKIGDVKALPLPMACTLTQFMAGYKYYFAVRAVDIRTRFGPFSLPGSILLLNKM